ncbi:MAG: hypothetical protein GXP10_06900 [Gammaproteobacteria bacterium]|nr:hypothetical protein [Gammaproteobacteria bacterium]
MLKQHIIESFPRIAEASNIDAMTGVIDFDDAVHRIADRIGFCDVTDAVDDIDKTLSEMDDFLCAQYPQQ